jgi:hypothetical protein
MRSRTPSTSAASVAYARRMRSNPHRPQRPAARDVSSGADTATGRPATPASRPSGLKLLLAGVDSDTRGLVESAVRHALGSRAVSESWTVSLVRIAGKWSVTLDGPEPRLRNLSFTADDDRLSTAIREAIGAPPAAGAAAGSAAAPIASPGTEARVHHVCERCQQRFVVAYEPRPGETKVLAAVACPHCWEISHLEIGDWAAAGRDYRAEKA